jgi:hypothetical protein
MIQVADVLPLVRNYARNQNLDDVRGVQVVNSAIQFVKSQIGLPGHEQELIFNFFDDQVFYAIPSGFAEPIYLRFDDDNFNRQSRFGFRPGELLFERVKALTSSTRLFGTYYGTGIPQLMVVSKNKVASILIDSFDSQTTVVWVGAGDASNLRYDSFTKKEGAASLAFDTTVNVAHVASLVGTEGAQDLTTVQNLGHFRFWAFLPQITNFSGVAFSWGSDNANFFKGTATVQQDGTPFVVGWNAIDIPWTSTVTQVGSPNIAGITFLQIDFTYTALFAAPVVNWRVDNLRVTVPDILHLNYYVNYAGKNVGGTFVARLTATTDVFLFGDFDPALMELVALQAAVIVNPQLLVDDKAVRQMYTDFMTLYKRTYPKKKVNNLLTDPLIARTSAT